MRINHAILHVFDFVACENVFAQEEIDLGSKVAKGYIARHLRKALGSIDNKFGAFAQDSAFAERIDAYFRGGESFVELSVEIGEYLARQLGHMEKPVSTDLLMVDFEDDEEASRADAADDAAAVDAAAHGPSMDVAVGFTAPVPRYLAIMLLESKQAYVHELLSGDGGERNGIARHHAVLPSPSQKLQSYAIVNLRTRSVQFVDKKRTIDGEPLWLIPDGLLQCSMEASSREALAAITEIVEAVAEEHGSSPTMAVSRAKAYVSENVRESDEVDLAGMAEAVFEDDPVIQERFEAAVRANELPARVPVEREAVRRATRNQRIRTDTGIEITFPAEYSRSPEYITFCSEADGTISIQIRNIGSIENR